MQAIVDLFNWANAQPNKAVFLATCQACEHHLAAFYAANPTSDARFTAPSRALRDAGL